MGSLSIDLEHASTARSHSRSGSRSPALAKPMMALAIASRGGSTTPQLWRAWMANSNAMPKRRVVSGSNLSPSRYCLIGIVDNSGASLDTIWSGRGLLSVGYPTKNPICSRIFSRGIFGETSRRQPRMTARRDGGRWLLVRIRRCLSASKVHSLCTHTLGIHTQSDPVRFLTVGFEQRQS